VEIGFPVAQAIAGLPRLADASEGEVGASELPGGRSAVVVHRGPYTELGDAYGRLHDWIHGQGEEDGPGPWETYIDSPVEVEDVSALRTEIWWPVAER
jgi:effector-binding domain-containing protein